MGNSCCQPSGPTAARRRKNQAGEPLADTLDQEIARTELVVFLSKQRAATGKLQDTVRQLHLELARTGDRITPLVHFRTQLLSSIQAIEEDRKVHKSIIKGLFQKLSDLESQVSTTPGLLTAIKTKLKRDPEFIELLVVQFTKFLVYRMRCARVCSEVAALIGTIESKAKAVLGEVDREGGRLTVTSSELALSRLGAEERVDKADIGKAEEGLVDSLFRLYQETEIEVEITRKEVGRLSEFCYDIYEETQGIRREFREDLPEEASLLVYAENLRKDLDSCAPCDSVRLREKIDGFAQLLEQAALAYLN